MWFSKYLKKPLDSHWYQVTSCLHANAKWKIQKNKRHSPHWTAEGEGGTNSLWEDGEPGTGRRRCPLKNLTDISRQGHVYREETCGWTPPANSEPDLRNCLQKFTNDISSSACSHVGEKKTQKRKKKKAKTKMHLIMTRTSIKNEPGRLRVKTKIPT